MNSEIEDNKFTCGDTVVIKKNAPSHLHPGEIVAVCGMIKIGSKDGKKRPLIEPTWLYTVEFNDGSSIELPEYYLEPYEEKE